MKIYKIIFAGLLLLVGMRYYTNAAHTNAAQSLDEEEAKEQTQKIRASSPDMYKLVLPNGQSFNFDKRLLEQSKILSGHINFLVATGRKDMREIPVTQYITKLNTTDPDEISLVTLHAILSAIAENPAHPTEALTPIIGINSPIHRLIAMLNIATYFEIEPLRQHVIDLLAQEFRKNGSDPLYKKAISDLPEDWQQEITFSSLNKDQKLQRILKTPILDIHSSKGGITCLAWSPIHTKVLFSSSKTGNITCWDTTTGNQISNVQAHPGDINAISLASDGVRLASCAEIRDLNGETLKIWNVSDNTIQPITTLRGRSVLALAWSPDGTQLASSHVDDVVQIWNTTTWQIIHTLRGHTFPANTLAWSPNGAQLVSGSHDQTVRIWDSSTGRELNNINLSAIERSMKHKIMTPGYFNYVSEIAWSPNGKFIAIGTKAVGPAHIAGANEHGRVILWDIRENSSKFVLTLWRMVESVAWSPDSKYLAFGFNNTNISIGGPRSGSSIRGSIQILEVAQQNEIRFFDPSDVGEITSIQWSPDGTEIAGGFLANSLKEDQNIGTIKLWDFSKFTLDQINLLEKIAATNKIELSGIPESKIYGSLSEQLKHALFKSGYGIPTFKDSNETDTPREQQSSRPHSSSNWISAAHNYITGKK